MCLPLTFWSLKAIVDVLNNVVVSLTSLPWIASWHRFEEVLLHWGQQSNHRTRKFKWQMVEWQFCGMDAGGSSVSQSSAKSMDGCHWTVIQFEAQLRGGCVTLGTVMNDDCCFFSISGCNAINLYLSQQREVFVFIFVSLELPLRKNIQTMR